MIPEYKFVTKPMAKKWLSTNYFNRTLNKSIVALYTKQMNDGEWICNTDGIAIDKDGILRNGQHRLTALVESDVDGVWMLVCFDCDYNGVYDKGRIRTTKDAIYMNNGHKYDLTILATAKLALRISGKSFGSKVPDSWVEKWIEDRAKLIEAIIPKTSGFQKKASVYLAAISAVENGVSVDSVKEWLEIIRTGLYSQPYQETAVRFRNWLISNGALNGTRMEMILKTAQNNISYFSAGKNCKKIYEAKSYTYEIH